MASAVETPLPSVPRLWAAAAGQIRARIGTFLSFALLFKGASALLITPLAYLVMRLAVRISGDVAVSNADLAGFALTPVGLLSLALAGTLALWLHTLEAAGFLALVLAGEGRTPVRAAFRTLLGRSFGIFHLAAAQTLRLAAAALPFLALLGGIWFLFLREHDINYYLAERPPAFLTAAAAAGAVLLAGAFLVARLWVRWALALPLLLEERLAPRAALRESARRVRGATMRAALALLGWAALLAGAAALCVLLFDIAGRRIVVALPRRPGPLLGVIAALFTFRSALMALASSITAGGQALLLHHLHAERGGAPPPAPVVAPEGRWSLLRAAALLLLLGAAAVLAGRRLLGHLDINDDVLVLAHRGASRQAPENTLASLRAAIDLGADWAEIDVRLTRDGEIVLHHDADLQRTAGVPLRVSDSTLEQLRTADLGAKFGPKFAGERIATLQQATDLARGRLGLDIELKTSGPEDRLPEEVARLLAAAAFESECVVTSLDLDSVRRVRRAHPRLRIGAILAVSMGTPAVLDVDLFALRADLATESFVAEAHRRGKEVFVWTVNDPVAMSDWIDRGADGILTDDPETLRALLLERASMSEAERLLLVARAWYGR